MQVRRPRVAMDQLIEPSVGFGCPAKSRPKLQFMFNDFGWSKSPVEAMFTAEMRGKCEEALSHRQDPLYSSDKGILTRAFLTVCTLDCYAVVPIVFGEKPRRFFCGFGRYDNVDPRTPYSGSGKEKRNSCDMMD
jgi:hypothetical protein